MIGLFYPSLHSNPKHPLMKTFTFSLLTFFDTLLASVYHKKKESRSRPKEENFLMLDLVQEKEASEDPDKSRPSITWRRTSMQLEFVR